MGQCTQSLRSSLCPVPTLLTASFSHPATWALLALTFPSLSGVYDLLCWKVAALTLPHGEEEGWGPGALMGGGVMTGGHPPHRKECPSSALDLLSAL